MFNIYICIYVYLCLHVTPHLYMSMRVMKVEANRLKRKAPAQQAQEQAPIAKKGKLPPFPGKPTKAVGVFHYGNYKIYTDMTAGSWRVQRFGDRKDRSSSFKKDPQGAWNKVLGYLKGR